MADKFRKTSPLRITFGAAEQPSYSKLTILAEQSRNGATLLEKAIGDPWGQSGDSTLYSYPIQLTNLARSIGEAKYMNPALFYSGETFRFYERIGTKYIGQNEGYLKYNTSGSVTQVVGTSFTTLVVEERLVNTAGEFWYDPSTGRFKTYTAIESSDVIYYDVDPTDNWYFEQDVLPAVIPDPRQPAFTGCRLEKNGGDYVLHLPPRIAITSAYWRGLERPTSYPTDAELSINYGTVSTSPYSMFQDPTVNALSTAHYRYPLPNELSGLAPGESIPEGFMYLWDQTNSTIVEDITFVIRANAWEFDIITTTQNAFLDARADAPGDETESSYNNPALSLIISSASLTKAHSTLLASFLNHEHNGKGTLERPLSHNSLEGMNPPTSAYSGHPSSYPSYLPTWVSSNWANDPHTALLNRAGAQLGSTTRDRYNNAMLGHFVLSNADDSAAHNFIDHECPDGSFKIYFGEASSSAASLFKEGVTEQLVYEDTNSFNNCQFALRNPDNNSGLYFVIDDGGEAWVAANNIESDGVYADVLNIDAELQVNIAIGSFPGSPVATAYSSGYFNIINRLGINESNPDTRLHIKSGENQVIKIEDTLGSVSGSYLDFRFNGYSTEAIKFGVLSTSGGYPVAGIQSEITGGNGEIQIVGTSDLLLAAGNGGFDKQIRFSTKGTEQWHIDETGNLETLSSTARVGIGTSPQTPFHIKKDGESISLQDDGGVGSYIGFHKSSYTSGNPEGRFGYYSPTEDTTERFWLSQHGNESLNIGSFGAGQNLNLYSNGRIDMYADADGTASPTTAVYTFGIYDPYASTPDNINLWEILANGSLIPGSHQLYGIGTPTAELLGIYVNTGNFSYGVNSPLVTNTSGSLTLNSGGNSADRIIFSTRNGLEHVEVDYEGNLFPTGSDQSCGGIGPSATRWASVNAVELNATGTIYSDITRATDRVIAGKGEFTDTTLKHPASYSEAIRRVARNSVLACGRVESIGTIDADSYGISSVSRFSDPGEYYVYLDNEVDPDLVSIIVSASGDSSGGPFIAQWSWFNVTAPFDRIIVTTKNSTSGAVANVTFSILVVGLPV